MLPLHHDPGRDTSCRGLRLVQSIGPVLTTTLSKSQGGRIRTGGLEPRACGLARVSRALDIPWSSPCGSRTHLSALKGRYPRPIDERAIERVGREALESPSAGLQPAAAPSQLPTHSAIPRKRLGVFVTPGLRLRARDVRGRASRPQGIGPERARRRIGGSFRFLATQDVMLTSDEHERPRCNGCLRPTRDRPHGSARRLVPLQTPHPGRMFARSRGDSRARSRGSPLRVSSG